MREYQQKAPQKLTIVCPESILWDEASVEIQAEVKENDANVSVQEFLQSVLKFSNGV